MFMSDDEPKDEPTDNSEQQADEQATDSHQSKRKNNQLTAIRQRSNRKNNPLTAISHLSKQENKSQIVISRRRPEAWTTPMRLPKEMRRQAAKVVVALRTLASALKVPERRCRPFPPPHSPTS